MRALIVGAGAVGQVYGLHLARGGAEVSVYVRKRHAREAERGYDLFAIHSRTRREKRVFVPHAIVTDPAVLRGERFDQVWLCVPSTSLLDGSMDPMLDAVRMGKSAGASVVSLLPGTFVKERLRGVVSEGQLVFGIIGMQSYHAPLEGSSEPYELETGPGTAYFFPPGGASMFSGVGDHAARAVDALRMGGAPARVVADAWVELGFSSALLMPQIAAIEAVGWSLDRFRRSAESEIAARAAREALSIVAAETHQPEPIYAELVRPFVVRLAFGLIAPRLAPLDLEGFFRYHFGKVGAQTRMLFDEYLREGEARGLPVDALRELRSRLGD